MCFLVTDRTEYTAKKDIDVYKVIYSDNKSFWRYFEYSSNTLYRLRKKLVCSQVGLGMRYPEIYEGFHSYSTAYIAYNHRPEGSKVVTFTIPRGAKFYYNNSEYVSSSIRSGDLKWSW